MISDILTLIVVIIIVNFRMIIRPHTKPGHVHGLS